MIRPGHRRTASPPLRKRLLLALGLTLPLAGCFEPEKTAVSYTAYNHTDQGIVSIIINGEGGILDAMPHVGGGEVCCVVIPKRWRPGLTARIKWRVDGDWLRDEKGQIVLNEFGEKIYVPAPWKEKIVPIENYGSKIGTFQIYFFPEDDMKVAVFNGNLRVPGHPLHYLVSGQ